jgi:DNA-binding XRE family transcriptional regulator
MSIIYLNNTLEVSISQYFNTYYVSNDSTGGLYMNKLWLRELRIKAQMSQREVAILLDIAQPHYWRWENGVTFPNAMQIFRLCEIFKCTPNDLFGFSRVC